MGEVAALSAAFEAETNKALATLPAIASCPPSEHDAHLNHHRAAQRVTELIAYYSSRLPPYACLNRILAIGDRLFKAGEHRLALDACYAPVQAQGVHLQPGLARMDDAARLSCHVQACYGAAACEAAIALAADGRIKHSATLRTLCACLHRFKDALALTWSTADLLWLNRNGYLHIYNLCKRLITSGYIAHALPFLLLALKMGDGRVGKRSADYLPFVNQIVTLACYAYCDVGSFEPARQLVANGLKELEHYSALHRLDPVPAPPEVQATFRNQRAALYALSLKLAAQAAPNTPPAASPPPTDKKAAAAAAATAQDTGLTALQPLIAELAVTPRFKFMAMLEALQAPGRRVIRHQPVYGLQKELFDATMVEAGPLISGLSTALEEAAKTSGDVRSEAAHSTSADQTVFAIVQQHEGKEVVWGALKGSQAYNPPEADAFSLPMHQTLLCTAFNFEQPGPVTQLLDLGKRRLAAGALGAADDAASATFSAVVRLLEAVGKLEQEPGAENLRGVAAVLSAVVNSAKQHLPDILADASLALHAAAKPLLDGVHCAQDKEAGLVVEVLRVLHACWEAVDLDDAVLRVRTALKLSLLLEEQAGEMTKDAMLYEARTVLRTGLAAVVRARCDAAAAARGADDEGVRWVSASRNQPNDAAARLMRGLTDTEGELACLHTDVLAALFRVELCIGKAEQKAAAVNKQARLMDAITRREAQSSIFGVRTMKEKRVDEGRIVDAGCTPANPAAKERELLAACGKNGYEKALTLIQMARFQAESRRAAALLSEAGDALTRAQEREDAQATAAQPPERMKTSSPLQPKVLQRTPTSVTITNFSFNLKGSKRPVRYSVFAKSYGAGVALILNKTASEYPGTGMKVPPGERVTVEGLRTNDTYVFGIAAYDEGGALIGELGTSSPEILAGLPLPLYYCWAHLLLTACKLQLWSVAKRAARVLFPHFVSSAEARPLWEANPMAAQALNAGAVRVSDAPLLRAFVQGVYAYTGGTLESELAATRAASAGSAQRGRPPPLAEVRTPYLEEQVARLVNLRRLVLAMEVSVVLGEEMLVQEGATRAYHLLGPLLTVKQKSGMLLAALASLYVSLQHVRNLIQDSQVGQELQRRAAARVACGVTLHALGLASAADETGVTSHLAVIQLELLKAYDPRFQVPGRAVPPELLPEIGAMQDGVLAHPDAPKWAAAHPQSVLAQRMADGADLAAQVLPTLAGLDPMAAWATHLAKEEAVADPRWVELVTRMLEACVVRGHRGQVAAVAEQVVWQVKATLTRPQLTFPGPKWRLTEAAAAALTGLALEADEQRPRPELEGLSDEAEKAAALAEWEAAKDAALQRKAQRIAAVTLLQRRLPQLLARKRAVDRCREQARRWTPWLSRLAATVAMVHAAKGLEEATARARARVLDSATEAAAGEGKGGAPGGDRPASPATGKDLARSSSPSPTRAPAARAGSPGGKPGSGRPQAKAPAAPPPPAAPVAETKSSTSTDPGTTAELQALLHLARGAQLAARSRSWHELLNCTRLVWNIGRALLNIDARLVAPVSPVVWEVGVPFPAPPPPPASMLQPATAGKDVKGGKGGVPPPPAKKEDPKAAKGKPDPKAAAGKKGAEASPPPATQPAWPPIWMPRGAVLNTGRVLRAAADALLDMVTALKEGDTLCTGVLPLPPTPAEAGTTQDGSISQGAATRPTTLAAVASSMEPRDTQAALDTTSSRFSYGSDLQVDLWYKASALNMDWVNRVIVTILTALNKMGRWHAIMAIGSRWLQLCEGAYNEAVLPLLLSAAPAAGADVPALQAAMDVVVRDKNAALTALAKVRATVRDKLGDVTLLNQAVGSSRLKKKRRAPRKDGPGKPGTPSSTATGTTPGDESASMVSSHTLDTQGSGRALQPEFVRIPAEYEKVMEVLKARGEKGSLILATNELGDVHAHFGNWGAAIAAWNDALDTLIGPYQVLKSWRKVFDPLSDRAVLQTYGLHGCLLAGGVLLGKLARYAHFAHLGLRLEAGRMAATLLRALFCVDAAHPQRSVGFATYVPRELWQGMDVFADPYRCNITDLLSGLETVVGVLVDAELALEALPVAALWEHVAYLVARDLKSTVFCRIQRANACIQLGLMREAAELLAGLLQGSQLPDPVLPTDLVLLDAGGQPMAREAAPSFNSAALPGDPSNAPMLQLVSSGPFAAPLAPLYGDWAVARLALARAAFLQALGAVPNFWESTDQKTGQRMAAGANPTPAVESSILEQAAALVNRAKAVAAGHVLEPEGPPAGVAGKAGAGKPSAAPAAGKEAKKGDATSGQAAGGGRNVPSASLRTGQIGVTPTIAAQRAEVAVRALLAEAHGEALRFKPQAAFVAALDALRFMGELAGEGRGTANRASHGLNVPLDDNDDTERFSLGPGLWLQAYVQAAEYCMQLRNTQGCTALLQRALHDAAGVNDARTIAQLLLIKAQLLQTSGFTGQALEIYADVTTRYQALQITDTRLAGALAEAARVRDALGLRQDSSRLYASAMSTSRAWVGSLGLWEAREHPQLVNLYLAGLPQYVHLLEKAATSALQSRQIIVATERLEEALEVLRHHSRCLPMHAAAVSFMLGRCLRLGMFTDDASLPAATVAPSTRLASMSSLRSVISVGSGIMAGAMHRGGVHDELISMAERAVQLLSSAYTLAALDGGHHSLIMRNALLELAAVYIHDSSAAAAAACLRHAHSVSLRRDVLRLSSHTLAPVAVDKIPEWLKEFVRGQEEGFIAQRTGQATEGGAAGAVAALSDTDVGRLVMCAYVALKRWLPSVPAKDAMRHACAIHVLHKALKSACPKYAADACMPEDVVLPPPLDSAPALQPGTVIVQWYIQDVTWQQVSSFRADGTLGGSKVTDGGVLALRPPEAHAMMLYVVVDYTGCVRLGERGFDVVAVRALQRAVREVAHRAESPCGPTDLFGHPAPSAAELAGLRRAVERFLAGQRVSEDGGAHDATLIPDQGAAGDAPAAEASPSPAPAAAPAGKGGKGGAKVVGKGAGAPAAATTPPPAPTRPQVPPPSDLGILNKLEALLDVEDGVDLVDAGFAEFLVQALPTNMDAGHRDGLGYALGARPSRDSS